MAHEAQVGQRPTVSAQTKAERAATPAGKAAGNRHTAVAATATADKYRGGAEGVLHDALHRIRSFQDDSKQYVRHNPTKAVCTALVVGFVLGLIFRR